MDSEYNFDYEEIKRKFESVPPTHPMMNSCRTTLYKTHFQPRTQSLSKKHETLSFEEAKQSSQFKLKMNTTCLAMPRARTAVKQNDHRVI